MKNNRIDYIDFIRGVGIILMIMGHVWFGEIFDKWIHAFHMPLFFVVSGFFYTKNNKRTYLTIVKKNVLSLIVPYIVLSTFYLILYYLLYGYNSMLGMIKYVCLFNTTTFPIAGAMWFLTSLFWTIIIYTSMDRLIHNNILKNIIFICIPVVITFFSSKMMVLPFGLSQSIVGIGFYHFGNKLYKYKDSKLLVKIKRMNILFVFLLFVINSIIILSNKNINMRISLYDNFILFWINAIVAILILWYCSRKICEYNFKSINFIKNIGENSIVYLCFNQIAIMLSRELLIYKIKYLDRLITLICTMIILYIIYFIIKKTFLNKMFKCK